MPDTTNTHIHVHKSWIAGSEAHFLCRCRRWSYGVGGCVCGGVGPSKWQGERERERGGLVPTLSWCISAQTQTFLLLLPPHQPKGFTSSLVFSISSRTTTHRTPASCPHPTSDTRPPWISARRCSESPQPSITTNKRGKWALNPAVTRLPALQFSCLYNQVTCVDQDASGSWPK